MCYFGTQFNGELASPGPMVGLDEVKDFFQSKWFYDSMILKSLGPVC